MMNMPLKEKSHKRGVLNPKLTDLARDMPLGLMKE
jgi:hypothetical protein